MDAAAIAGGHVCRKCHFRQCSQVDVLVIAPQSTTIAARGVAADDRTLIDREALVAPDSATVPSRLIAGDGAAMDVAMAERAKIHGAAFSQRSSSLGRLIVQQLRVGHCQRGKAADKNAAADTTVPGGGGVRNVVLDGAIGDSGCAAATGIGKRKTAA